MTFLAFSVVKNTLQRKVIRVAQFRKSIITLNINQFNLQFHFNNKILLDISSLNWVYLLKKQQNHNVHKEKIKHFTILRIIKNWIPKLQNDTESDEQTGLKRSFATTKFLFSNIPKRASPRSMSSIGFSRLPMSMSISISMTGVVVVVVVDEVVGAGSIPIT